MSRGAPQPSAEMIEQMLEYAEDQSRSRNRPSAVSFSNHSKNDRESMEAQDGESCRQSVNLHSASTESTWSIPHDEMLFLPKDILKYLCESCAATIEKYSSGQSGSLSGHLLRENRARVLSDPRRGDLTIRPSSSDTLQAVFTLARTPEGLIGVYERIQEGRESVEAEHEHEHEQSDKDKLLFIPRGRILHEHVLKPATSLPILKAEGMRSSSSGMSRRDSKVANVQVNSRMSECSNGLLDLLLNQVDGNFRCSSLHKMQEETGIKFAKPFQLLSKMVAQREEVDGDIDLLIEQWNSQGYIDGDLFIKDLRERQKGDSHEKEDESGSASQTKHECEFTPEGFDSKHFQMKHSIRWSDGFCVRNTAPRAEDQLEEARVERSVESLSLQSDENQSGTRRSLNDQLQPNKTRRSVLRRPTDWQLVNKRQSASHKPQIKTTIRRISFSELPLLHESKALPRVLNRRSYLQSVMQAAARVPSN